eukprot:4249002-Amphidinium_carterae.1
MVCVPKRVRSGLGDLVDARDVPPSQRSAQDPSGRLAESIAYERCERMLECQSSSRHAGAEVKGGIARRDSGTGFGTSPCGVPFVALEEGQVGSRGLPGQYLAAEGSEFDEESLECFGDQVSGRGSPLPTQTWGRQLGCTRRGTESTFHPATWALGNLPEFEK